MSFGDTDREYPMFADDGCAGCGAPRMHGSPWCFACASADVLSDEEVERMFPASREGHWHLASRTDQDGTVIEVYEGPTFYPVEQP